MAYVRGTEEDRVEGQEQVPPSLTLPQRLRAGISRNVLVLGVVSLFTDISSEMIAPMRILFLIYTLQTPLVLAGMIEGIAESSSSLLKIASGYLADRTESRKPAIVAGYTLSNLLKPLLALAQSWQFALGLIIGERFGKGIRTSPRDALLADSSPAEYRGKAFGFHRGMDTLGAAIGPLIAAFILAVGPSAITNSLGVFSTANPDSIRAVFAWSAVPGAISVIIALIFLRDRRRERPVTPVPAAVPHQRASLRSLGRGFWIFTIIATIFSLGNSSDAFIFLRTSTLEQSLEAVPLLYFGYNLVYAVLATPLGSLSDRIGRLPLIGAGYLMFAVVYFGWSQATQGWHTVVLFLIYGVYAAATEGAGKAFVTDLVDRRHRGAAMGWYNGLTGFAALPGNILAGWLWSTYNPSMPFRVGAIFALIAAGLILLVDFPSARESVPEAA